MENIGIPRFILISIFNQQDQDVTYACDEISRANINNFLMNESYW
jgi:hypothetical protein